MARRRSRRGFGGEVFVTTSFLMWAAFLMTGQSVGRLVRRVLWCAAVMEMDDRW